MEDDVPEKVYRAMGGGESEEVTLPEFECFKRVRAGKIVALGIGQAEKTTRLGLAGGAHVEVSHAWVSNKLPQVGGYFVQYEDGYSSYSPAKAFEEGYKPLSVEAAFATAEVPTGANVEILAVGTGPNYLGKPVEGGLELPSAEDLDAAAAEKKAAEETAPATEGDQAQPPASENAEPGPAPVDEPEQEAAPALELSDEPEPKGPFPE